MTILLPVLEGASCAGMVFNVGQGDPFFPPKATERQSARRLYDSYCASCPAYAKCLTWAVKSEDEEGIWAGTTPDQRAEMRAS